jgi:hypothetical protein
MSSPKLKAFVRSGFWIGITVLVSLFSTSAAFGQGFGGQPIRTIPLKVVIMLGPEFDFKQPPFTNAAEVKTLFSGTGEFMPPTLNTITVDVTTPLPEVMEPTVVATYPPETSEEELQILKRSVQLNAVRFGINQVEMVAHDEQDPNSEVYSIWLRVPRNVNWDTCNRYAEIAVALASQLDGPFHATQARIDLFEGPPQDNPFGGDGAAMDDPFSQRPQPVPATDDPFGGQAAVVTEDPFGVAPSKEAVDNPFGARSAAVEPANRLSGPGGTSGEVQTVEQLASEIAKIKKHRMSLQADLARVVRDHEKPKAIELAKTLISQDLQVQVQLQKLEILLLEQKLANLKSEFQVRIKPESLQDLQQQRLKTLFAE